MFGFWPSCAYQGCLMPAIVQVRNARDGQELSVDLCVLHLTLTPAAVKEMQTLRHEDLPELLSYEEKHDEEI